MDLREYLKKADLCVAQFARRIGVSAPTIHHVLAKKDVKAFVTVLIEMETKGNVRCHEMVSDKHLKKYVQRKKENSLL
jgi:DNA transposition AAA+ family ATPase